MENKITYEEFQEKLNQIKHTDKNGTDYWLARELGEVLGHKTIKAFRPTLLKAIHACKENHITASEHFDYFGSIVKTGVSTREIEDYKLSSYACFLIAHNSLTSKYTTPYAIQYFSNPLIKKELSIDEYQYLTDAYKNLYNRKVNASQDCYILNRSNPNTSSSYSILYHAPQTEESTISNLTGSTMLMDLINSPALHSDIFQFNPYFRE